MLARVRTPSSPVREREREIKRELLFLILKGMTSALAPFSYLIYIYIYIYIYIFAYA